jgi:pimeloyl-ACP methyl ester carboxylesterase
VPVPRLSALCLLLGCGGVDPAQVEPPDPGVQRVVLLIHGAADDPSVWDPEVLPAMEVQRPSGWAVRTVDWSDGARNRVRAPARGRRLGEELAAEVETWSLDALHVVAHSAGAHLAHGLLSETSAETVQLTLLDPYVGSGLFRWGYGRDRFGAEVDAAFSYVNRDDGVPATDGLLDMAHNVDVTALRPASLETAEEGHRWPVTFYGRSAGSGFGLDLAAWSAGPDDWDAFPAGRVTVLNP